ncbi:serine/threonine-protein kinase [Modestobacter sp. VKM Ac-2986]|uniref:serine/threonine-protein kinase n=1 Tax=Modestobacter sp. VKM Ac-2986 TaxID=3004140 RepID=UPI0022AB0E7E|nr:serine/threonine-protein kinase [Modestobacter sp. VKM Ac-2986]MCZ2828480.1 serine/threonine-protein kinase [Modestobacter sp. VKM Ac-2986]
MTTGPGAGERLVGGRYLLGAELGRGGMGVVWQATDQVLQREVALKEITYPVHLTDDERAVLRERTLREARAAARLDDPHVVTVHDVVEEDGRPWLVMEHVRSRSLQQVLENDGPLSPSAVARIGLDVLSAIEVAHAAGIVHRDVKPGNVLVDGDGHACLTDFGIATSTDDSSLTTQGAVLGSPSYMAPERARGEESTPSIDLWSLGATLYTAVEGHTPFDRGAPMATLLAVVDEEPAPTTAAGPLGPVLSGLLTKDPAARMTAAEARRGLAQVAAGVDAEPAAPRTPVTGGAKAAARGGQVERFDLADLLALASSSKAVVTTVVRGARDQAKDAAGRRRADAEAAPTRSRHERRQAVKQRRLRFKRRWVVVPMVLLALLVLLVLGALALLVTGVVELS